MYRFWGANGAGAVRAAKDADNQEPTAYGGIDTPCRLYEVLLQCGWTAQTCAPRLRGQWSTTNPTLGQCSITSFLAQDIFGGEVYGVRLPNGAYHCYNVVDGVAFDLTSEQFGDEVLCYDNGVLQQRQQHFADPDKYARYCMLCDNVRACCGQ